MNDSWCGCLKRFLSQFGKAFENTYFLQKLPLGKGLKGCHSFALFLVFAKMLTKQRQQFFPHNL